MVIESLVNPISAVKSSWKLMFLGFLYTTIGMLLSYWIFAGQASLVMVFFVVMACSPLMYQTIKSEEQVDLKYDDERKILKEHSKALKYLMYLFFGITLAYAFWYLVLPNTMANALFSVQAETITKVNSKVTGDVIQNLNLFSRIFFNNLKVMIFCILFSVTFGLGAIFILVWNASVIGVALGNFIRSHMSMYSSAIGFVKAAGYLHVTSWGIMRYAIHGIPEILAYFIAGLAGGIISIAIVRHDFGTKKFDTILLDATDLVLMAIMTLVVAGLIETFITPMLF